MKNSKFKIQNSEKPQISRFKERPILFSGPMVRAILEGRKTQTRRVVKHDSSWVKFYDGDKKAAFEAFHRDAGSFWNPGCLNPGDTPHWQSGDEYIFPNYQVGDRLWVRETFAYCPGLLNEEKQVVYRADHATNGWKSHRADLFDFCKWRPSIHMPRWASRITLEITDVRVERLQDITREDAIAEGIEVTEITEAGGGFGITWPRSVNYKFYGKDLERLKQQTTNPVWSYRSLWESINGEESWGLNPWVWVIKFKRLDA